LLKFKELHINDIIIVVHKRFRTMDDAMLEHAYIMTKSAHCCLSLFSSASLLSSSRSLDCSNSAWE